MIKQKSQIFLLIILVTSVFSLLLFSNSVKYDPFIENVDYTIDLFDLKMSGPQINITTPENITYSEPMSGYYSATYGFENDEIGDDPEDWIIWMEDDTIEVVSEIAGHKNVLRLYDSSSSTQNHIQHQFSAKDHGQIEFWMRSTDVNDHIRLEITNPSDTDLFHFDISSGNFEVVTGSGTQNLTSAINDQWYHIKIVFRASYGSTYEGLISTYTWKVFIDTYEYGAYTFMNNQDVEWIRASTAYVGASGVNFYLDAVGYSWDTDYSMGDNLNEGLLLSFENSTSLDWIGYSLDMQDIKTTKGNITILFPSNDGLHTIQMFGNNSFDMTYQSRVRYFSVDINAPTSVVSFTPYTDPNIVIRSTVFTITADDGLGSGISLIKYKINDSIWYDYLGPFNLSSYEHGIYNISYYAIDNVGHIESENSIKIILIPEPSESGIPGYHLGIMICVISIVSWVIIKKRFES